MTPKLRHKGSQFISITKLLCIISHPLIHQLSDMYTLSLEFLYPLSGRGEDLAGKGHSQSLRASLATCTRPCSSFHRYSCNMVSIEADAQESCPPIVPLPSTCSIISSSGSILSLNESILSRRERRSSTSLLFNLVFIM